jgi:hypothetical protein
LVTVAVAAIVVTGVVERSPDALAIGIGCFVVYGAIFAAVAYAARSYLRSWWRRDLETLRGDAPSTVPSEGAT